MKLRRWLFVPGACAAALHLIACPDAVVNEGQRVGAPGSATAAGGGGDGGGGTPSAGATAGGGGTATSASSAATGGGGDTTSTTGAGATTGAGGAATSASSAATGGASATSATTGVASTSGSGGGGGAGSCGACGGELSCSGGDCVCASPPCAAWSTAIGGAGLQHGRAVAMDAAGNLVIAGEFDGAIDFGQGPTPVVGSNDAFAAKLDFAGAILWGRAIGGAGNEIPTGVATDAAGDVYLLGWAQGTVDFGCGPMTSAGDADVFLVKLLANDGSCAWSHFYGGAGDDFSGGIAVGPSGAVAITGSYQSASVDLGCGAHGQQGGDDLFVGVVDPQGACVWSKRGGDAQSQGGGGITFDSSGSLLLTGQFAGQLDLGGGAMTSVGAGQNAFLARFDASGAHLFSKRYGSGPAAGMGVAPSSLGTTAFLTGSFDQTVDFGCGNLQSSAGASFFAAGIAANGACQFSLAASTATLTYGRSIAAVGANAIATGVFWGGPIDFGAPAPILPCGGQADAFLVELDPSGVPLWARHFASTGFAEGSGIVASPNGDRFAVVGDFSATLDSGSGVLTANAIDAFVSYFWR